MPWILSITLIVFAPLVFINIFNARKIASAIVQSTGWPRGRTRWLVYSSFIYLNLLPAASLIAFWIGGRETLSAFNGDNRFIDIIFSYPFWVALVVNVQLFVFFMIAELLKLAFHSFSVRMKDRWNQYQATYVLLAMAAVMAYSFVTIYRDTWTVRVAETEVTVSHQFAALNNLRIVQISDVQGDGRTTESTLREYVEKVNSLKPDLIFFAGDVVTSGEKYIGSTTKILGQLSATYGKYASVGDHDIFSNKKKTLEALKENGFQVIEDSTVIVQVNSCEVALTGVTYTYPQKPKDRSLALPAVDSPDKFKIMLVHQPAEKLVALAEKKGYNLFLAGHTHGGGVAFGIPKLGFLAPSRFESRYLSGFYRVGGLLVSVTNGLGFTLAPIRFNAPAEITLLQLKRATV